MLTIVLFACSVLASGLAAPTEDPWHPVVLEDHQEGFTLDEGPEPTPQYDRPVPTPQYDGPEPIILYEEPEIVVEYDGLKPIVLQGDDDEGLIIEEVDEDDEDLDWSVEEWTGESEEESSDETAGEFPWEELSAESSE